MFVDEHKRIRADYYLYYHFMSALGTFSESEKFSVKSVLILFGINKPVSVNINGNEIRGRFLIVDSNTDTQISGGSDLMFVMWIDPGTILFNEIRKNIPDGQKYVCVTGESSGNTVIQTTADEHGSHEILELSESLLKTFCGIKPLSSFWNTQLRDFVKNSPPWILLENISGYTEVKQKDLNEDFIRLTGMSLKYFLYRRKIIYYVSLRQKGIERHSALSKAMLPGWESIRRDFRILYGADLETLEKQLPYARVLSDGGDLLVNYLPV
jgi:hypothetical protein